MKEVPVEKVSLKDAKKESNEVFAAPFIPIMPLTATDVFAKSFLNIAIRPFKKYIKWALIAFITMTVLNLVSFIGNLILVL